MPTYATADYIINTSCQELGLPAVSLSSAAGDATGYQMLGMLNALGDELVRIKDWQFLEKVMTFTGDGVSESFPLPENYGRQINQTEWSTSNMRPMIGPDSPQMWAWAKYGLIGAGVSYRYRILDNEYVVFPIPGVGQEFALYYISKNWVKDGTVVPPAEPIYTDRVIHNTDLPLFDRRMMIAGLKVKLWAMKGFDTSTLAEEFTFLLNAEKSQNQGARVINLGGSQGNFLIGVNNVPDGSWSV